MLRTILIILGLLIAGILGFAATRPKTFRVARSKHIDAPPERIQPYIADFHRWAEWSPYETLDPNMARTFSGAESGPGAVYEWSGDKAGAGRMEILQAETEQVGIDLQFTKPFAAHNQTLFTLAPSTGGTDVTWAMSGDMSYLMRVMCIFVSMDKLVGKDFETGLANLKRVAQA
ncbi:MAG TPA: SRPBCC family protein [Rhodothermales bacterium]